MILSVCGQFCGIFGGFFAVVGPLLHECCLSQVVPLCLVAINCTAEGYEPVCALLKCAFFAIFPAFFVFFRGGSNMVAFRAKVDGTWQAKFPRRLRHRVTGLRPSGLPNLPFSLVLSFPPFSSASPPFSLFSPTFTLFSLSLFPSLFFHFFPQFSSNFPSPPLTSSFFQRFLVKATRLHVTPLSAMCPTRHLPHTGRDML